MKQNIELYYGTTLREKMALLFREALFWCRGRIQLEQLAHTFRQCEETLEQPMRVALVGKVNSGKSTVMNAFLGEKIAQMANRELTYNVNWFKYGPELRIIVHKTDGSSDEKPFSELKELTARCTDRTSMSEEDKSYVDSISFIEVQLPNPFLRNFELIDTPGLHSFYKKDSRNTLELLTSERTRPHALIFLFENFFSQADLLDIERFHKATGPVFSGMTAIAALNGVDRLNEDDCWPVAEAIIRQTLQRPAAARAFFSIQAVMGRLGLAAKLLSQDDFSALLQLSKLNTKDLEWLLKYPRRFILENVRLPFDLVVPSVEQRRSLYELLDLYGIRYAVQQILQGAGDSVSLNSILWKHSRVGELRDMVVSHFGNRSYLVKAYTAIVKLSEAIHTASLKQAVNTQEAFILGKLSDMVERVLCNEPRFKEFSLLKEYYAFRGDLDDHYGSLLDDEERERLLELSGERGESCASRLGFEHEASMEEMLSRVGERIAYWKEKANGFDVFMNLESRERAAVIEESYEYLRERLVLSQQLSRRSVEILLKY